MKANYHTHTQRCRHASGSEADYLRHALEAGLDVLGFSDHGPFPDHDFQWRMLYEELEDHLETVKRLAEEHAGEIIIRQGLEIEYMPQYRSYYERLIGEGKVDYLLLGEHLYADGTGRTPYISEAADTRANLVYARAIEEGMRTGLFRMVAHPDFYALNRFAWDDNCEAAADIIIGAAVETGTVLEMNANGLRKGVCDGYPEGPRYQYPHRRFWEKAAAAGARVIVGSDCHDPRQVWDEAVAQAYGMLKELGITPLACLEDIG